MQPSSHFSASPLIPLHPSPAWWCRAEFWSSYWGTSKEEATCCSGWVQHQPYDISIRLLPLLQVSPYLLSLAGGLLLHMVCVPAQHCHPVPAWQQQCRRVTEQDCYPVVTKKCQTVVEEDCQTVTERKCKSVHREKCRTVGREVCTAKHSTRSDY